MFDLGRFDLLRFNLRMEEDADDVQLSGNLYATINAMATRGENTRETAFITAVTQGELVGAAGVRVSFAGGGQVRAGAGIHALYTGSMEIAAAVQGDWWLSEDAHTGLLGDAETLARVLFGANFRAGAVMPAAVQGGAEASIDLQAPAFSAIALFDAQVTTIRFAYGYAEFDMTLPPGATLIVDSNGYVVLLDGESAIHAHSGDWLHLNRDTFDVTFEPMAGQPTMDTSILYTERWV